MSRIHDSIVLFNLLTNAMDWGVPPPTSMSTDKIYETLGIQIPKLYELVGTMCPNYGAYLNGIGEDFKSDIHILRINENLRARGKSGYLSNQIVAISHGEDGGYDCLDLRKGGRSDESRIVRIQVKSSVDEEFLGFEEIDVVYDSFEDYFAEITTYYSKAFFTTHSEDEIRRHAFGLIKKLCIK